MTDATWELVESPITSGLVVREAGTLRYVTTVVPLDGETRESESFRRRAALITLAPRMAALLVRLAEIVEDEGGIAERDETRAILAEIGAGGKVPP